MSENGKMSFLEHLEELRQRLIKCVVALVLGMIACWIFRDYILSFLLVPLYDAWSRVDGLPEPGPLNFTGMLGPFIAYLKLSAIGGIFVGAPVILYQLWQFVAPGLYKKERRLALPFVFISSLLFIGGSIMAYKVVFPLGFRFFLEFAAGQEMTVLKSSVSVTAAHGPAKPTQTGKPKEASESDEWLIVKVIRHLQKKDCGKLDAVAVPDTAGVTLLFNWDAERCGDPPKLEDLKRNGAPLDVQWTETKTEATHFRRFAAEDEAAQPGDHVYELKFPTDPKANRLTPMLMIQDYLSLVIQLILAFGLIFEVPIFISFLSFAGIVNYRQLLKFSRWFVVLAFVAAAVLTPTPDALTQCLLAVPLIALYFLSVLVAFFFGPKPD